MHNSRPQQPRDSAPALEEGETRLQQPQPLAIKLWEEPGGGLAWSPMGESVPTNLEEKRGHVSFADHPAPASCNLLREGGCHFGHT